MSARTRAALLMALLGAAPAWSQTITWDSGTYSYDAAGNVKSIGTEQYRYDAFGRLAAATVRTGQTQSATYDAFGNIHTLTTAGTKIVFGVDLATNRLTKTTNPITGEPANVFGTYDDVGQLTSSVSGDTCTYDGAGMITAASVNGESKVYLYTASDERLATITILGSTATGSEWTIRDTAGKVLRRLEKNGTQWSWKEDYVYLGDKLLAAEVDTSARTLHFHLDHLGTPRVITGNGGWKIAEHTYFPFGEEATNATQDTEKLKFTGHERDTRSLDYMHARFYNPKWGRFLSVDPLRGDPYQPQSWNLYTYVYNRPISYTDPMGLQTDNATAADLRKICPDCSTFVATMTVESTPLDWSPIERAVLAAFDAFRNDPWLELGRAIASEDETQIRMAQLQFLQMGMTAFMLRGRGDGPDGNLRERDWFSPAKYETRVTRWMSEAEYRAFKNSGVLQIGGGGRTYVTAAGAPKPGGVGPIRVDFNVPTAALEPGGVENWYFIGDYSRPPVTGIVRH